MNTMFSDSFHLILVKLLGYHRKTNATAYLVNTRWMMVVIVLVKE
jgi:hypothetical protein